MLNRAIQPALPAGAYQTFEISAPRNTHFRRATCAEVECPATVNGWVTVLDETSEQQAAAAYYIRKQSGRHFTEERNATGLTVFTFTAGQPCFDSGKHHVRVERQEHFLVRPGDFRALGRPRQHTRPEFWVEEFAEHQDQLARRIERG